MLLISYAMFRFLTDWSICLQAALVANVHLCLIRLTAFISKVFCQAKKVVDDSVEESVHVSPTINWLTTHQNNDGSFTEYNYVNHGPLMVSMEKI